MIIAIIMFGIGIRYLLLSQPIDRKKLPQWQRMHLMGLILVGASIPAVGTSFLGSVVTKPGLDTAFSTFSGLLIVSGVIAALLLAFTEIGVNAPADMLAAPDALIASPLENAEAYIQRGSERANVGDIAGATLDFSTALTLDPHNSTAYFLRGKAYIRIDRIKAAMDFKRVLELEPNHPQAVTLRNFVNDAG